MTLTQQLSKLFALSTIAIVLSACGGGGGSDQSSDSGDNQNGNGSDVTPNPNTDLFTIKAKTWSIQPATNTAYCYDIDTQKQLLNCDNNDWDLKFYMGTRTPVLFTNSGVSGSGLGGALSSPFNATWTDLLKEKNATQNGSIPSAAWIVDSYSNAFMDTISGFNSFFEYDLFGDHRMSPNFKTFLISTNPASKDVVGTTEQPVFALQITGYYQGTTSGHISLRYINTAAPSEIKTISVDASKGWSYVDLNTGTSSSSRDGKWQLAFNRYSVELNEGFGSTIASQPAGFYDDKGAVIVEKFKDVNALNATQVALGTAAAQGTVARWGSNSVNSILNPAYQGAYPSKLSYGWYNYYPTLATAQADGLGAAHMLGAIPDAASMIRSNTGKSYARMHLKNIQYADNSNASSQTTWTFEFDIQPAS